VTEKELRTRFENLTLAPQDFPHREHVRLAWTYLCDDPLLDVLRIFPENLRRFAESAGKPGLYHETVTWAYLMIIAERIDRCGERVSWQRFIEMNPDLLGKELLERYYDKEALASDEARRRFLFPDGARATPPASG
jgi:hypothetical protein